MTDDTTQAATAEATATATATTVEAPTPAPAPTPTVSAVADDNAIENTVWQWYKAACSDMQNWTLLHPYVWLKQELHKLIAALKAL